MKLQIGTGSLEAARIFCIGRNYRAHIQEFNDEVPASPIVFCKSPFCLVPAGEAVPFPGFAAELHHEVEVVVAVGKAGRPKDVAEAESYIAGLALGLDLTARDVQFKLIEKGLPWEICKSFEASAPIGEFVPYPTGPALNRLEFSCSVNGKVRQQGCTDKMIFSIPVLLVELAKIWTLRPGDLIYTGTPEGVGPLHIGDTISISGNFSREFSWKIVQPA